MLLRPASTVRRTLVGAARLLPGFLLAFLAVAAANSAGIVPASAHIGLTQGRDAADHDGALGGRLSIDLDALRRTGPRPIALGAALWVTVATTSLALTSPSAHL